MTTPTYHFAVIGLGQRGRYHLNSIEAMPEVRAQCVAVADPRDPTAEETARYGNAFYKDYRQLLDQEQDLDFVIVASLAADHKAHALAALKQGIPVFLEKPVGMNWEEAVELYQRVTAQNYPLFIGYNLRRFPAALAMKQILDEGRLGRIQGLLAHVNTGNRWSESVLARYTSPPTSALIIGKLTHDTDTIHHCLQAEPIDCCATITCNVYQRGPTSAMRDGDTCCISGLLTNGALYTIHLTTAGPDYERRYVVNGTEGQMDVILHTSRPGPRGFPPRASLSLWRVGEEPHSVDLPPATGGHGGADFRIHRDFMQWLGSQPDGPDDARSILTGMVIPTAALDSMRTGRRIDCGERLRQAVTNGVAQLADA